MKLIKQIRFLLYQFPILVETKQLVDSVYVDLPLSKLKRLLEIAVMLEEYMIAAKIKKLVDKRIDSNLKRKNKLKK